MPQMRQDSNTDSGSSKRGKLSSLIQKLQLMFDWSTVHILCAFDGTSYINTLSTNAAAASFILYPWPPGPQACALPRPAMNSRVMQAAHVGREQMSKGSKKKKKKAPSREVHEWQMCQRHTNSSNAAILKPVQIPLLWNMFCTAQDCWCPSKELIGPSAAFAYRRLD